MTIACFSLLQMKYVYNVKRRIFPSVYCSPGTYSQGGRCTFCEVGTYQDQIGMSECKACPLGTSTEFTGSTAVEECTGKLKSKMI